MAVKKQTQPQNAKQQQTVCRCCKKPGQVNKECQKFIRKKQKQHSEKQTTRTPNAKHTHFIHTDKETITRQTWFGLARTRLIDPKDIKLNFLMTLQGQSHARKLYAKCPDGYPQESFELKKPQPHWSPITLASQYVISERRTILNRTYQTICKGYPAIVWQQQMKTVYIERNRKMQ